MRRILTIAGLVAAIAAPALVPAKASAESCAQRAHDRRVGGTLLGAVGGGLLGNAVAHGGGRLGGTLIGAGVGAVVGHSLASGGGNCYHRAYYRHSSRARPAAYADQAPACRTETRGFYDARGRMVYAPTQVCG